MEIFISVYIATNCKYNMCYNDGYSDYNNSYCFRVIIFNNS